MTTNDTITIDGTTYAIVGFATVGGYDFPVLKADGLYCVDLGGAGGISDPFEFDSDEDAVSELAASLAAELEC